MNNVKITQLNAAARVPLYATSGSGCFDLHACMQYANIVTIVISPGKQAAIGTGLAFAVPPMHIMNIYGRSGHAANARVSLANGVGKIDSDYRGEVKVLLRNDGDEPFVVRPGDRIAQAEIVQSPRWAFTLVAELDATERGAAGFGSTGVGAT